MTQIRKILFISSSQHFVNTFLIDLLKSISKNQKISLITNFEEKPKGIDYIDRHHVSIKRKISIFSDFKALFLILIKIHTINPNTIVSVTPKTILFGIVAKFLKPSINRIHIYTGFTWVTMTGLKRKFFIFLDKLNIIFSNKILFDSQSQIDYLKNKNFNIKKFHLINKGSIKGVKSIVFFKFKKRMIENLKKKYGVPNKYKIILYIGRMDPDKGIKDLIQSFSILLSKTQNVFLLLVGRDEMNIEMLLKKLDKKVNKKILYIPNVAKPQEIYNLSDIVCLPSKREGFGNVVIESSACEIPVVGSDIFGLKSSLINNLNGLTFELGNINDLTSKLYRLISNKDLCLKFGKKGREYVKQTFDSKEVINSLQNLIVNK